MKKILISFLAAFLFKCFFFPPHRLFEPDLVFITLLIFVLWEGNFMIDRYLNTKYSWVINPQKRLKIQLIVSVIFTSLMFFIVTYTLHQLRFRDGRIFNRKMIELFPIALSITFCIIAIRIGKQFFDALRTSLLEVERYKTESANAQLQNLKNQLNPHFLFNNLSVLSSLVYKNQDKAVHFITELSKVYRYVLDNTNSELVSLQQELEFIDHYIYLQKIRFEDRISFEMTIDEDQKKEYLLPMCLQTLVENTIQHNEASLSCPLKVLIFTQNDTLVVVNEIHPRTDKVNSSQLGLKNIQSRYAFFTDKKVEIINNGTHFKVILPLLKRK